MATIKEKGQINEATCEQERLAINDTLELLGGKWRLRIMRYLGSREQEHNTFKKMQREIGNISAKVLANELADLEQNMLITRTVMDSRPVTVRYAISTYGKTVLPLTENIAQWGLDHRKMIRS
ncbi:winged helix-turn-helix transcriptional regulator [Pedobacter antarcticus]|uniref:winged helix-turn-helix transcriptional regulator n=1 Tax=Pedobacter antarcticus TaxID=34086 RepID=UPI001C59728B|nr:helix-turn-helix domain-containing protein [Pedobacter antarcticus]